MNNTKCNATPEKELIKKKKRKRFVFKSIFNESDTEYYKNWISFYPKKSYFKFKVDAWGYFDPRPQLISNVTSIIVVFVVLLSAITMSFSLFHLALIPFLFFGWGDFYINLPFDTGMTDECENPSYGFYMYHIDPIPKKINFPTCFIWQWGNYKSFDMPWAKTWIRTSILLKNGSWEHERKGDKKEFYNEEWKDRQYMVEYDFIDKSDNSVIPTKVYVEEREWRQHWLKFTRFFSTVRKTIDVHFSKEVGSRKGSWKGGTIGCGYPMKKGETALECIKRMESERTFR